MKKIKKVNLDELNDKLKEELVTLAVTKIEGDVQMEKTYKVQTTVSAKQVRLAYVQGYVTDELMAQYDMFRKRNTATNIQIHNFELTGLTVETEY